jgi:hypothetical protein
MKNQLKLKTYYLTLGYSKCLSLFIYSSSLFIKTGTFLLITQTPSQSIEFILKKN